MTKILKDYENWFIKFKQSKKYWPEICDLAARSNIVILYIMEKGEE